MNWNRDVLARLARDMQTAALTPPTSLTIDDQWHRCAGGYYLLFVQPPYRALYRRDDAQIIRWVVDNRHVSPEIQREIRAAINRLPTEEALAKRSVIPTHFDAQMNQHRARKLEKARALITTMLATGTVPADEVRARAASHGMSWTTVQRAAKELCVTSHRLGFGANGGWHWRLHADSFRNVAR